MKTPSILFSAVFLSLSVAALGADKTASVAAADEAFLKLAADNSVIEVELARLGVQKASTPEVKELANALATEQASLNESIKALAESKAVMLSAIIDPSGATAFRALERFTGKPFDDAFLSRMQTIQGKTVAAYEKASQKAQDSEVKAFVQKWLPMLRSHLDSLSKLAPPPPDTSAVPIGP
jgi:putative membrane protein